MSYPDPTTSANVTGLQSPKMVKVKPKPATPKPHPMQKGN